MGVTQQTLKTVDF